jgi:hypothetical protein
MSLSKLLFAFFFYLLSYCLIIRATLEVLSGLLYLNFQMGYAIFRMGYIWGIILFRMGYVIGVLNFSTEIDSLTGKTAKKASFSDNSIIFNFPLLETTFIIHFFTKLL